MTSRTKLFIKLSLRISFTIVALLWVFDQIDFQQFRQELKMARWEYLIPVWMLTIILLYVNSEKMRFILRKQDCSVNTCILFGASAVSFFYSMFMPGPLSTGVKWYILKKHTRKGCNVLSSMVYNQLSVMIVMAVSGLAVLIITNPIVILLPDVKTQWLLPVICGMSAITIIIISLLLLNRRTGEKAISLLGHILRYLPERVQQKGEEILGQLAVFQTVGYRFHFVIAFITIMNSFAGSIVLYILSAKGASIVAPLGVFFWLPAIIYILGKIPISIANLGVREVTLVSILKLYGIEGSAVLLMSMILFSTSLFMAIIGVFYQLSWAGAGKPH